MGQGAPELQQLLGARGMQGVTSSTQDAAPPSSAATATPAAHVAPPASSTDAAAELLRFERLEAEIRDLKNQEGGPRRFAADLFEFRQPFAGATEGGISDDYVLGPGDQLQLNAFGSATFELPLRVDARGEVVVPKVGTVKVAGQTLGKARSAVQVKVGALFSRTTVDLSVIKMRDVRIFILGEVYKPGGYLVPSMSSLVNVLGLAGGPDAQGSFRELRVVRGGRVIHTVDLYPLRTDGLGNMNFTLQNGDTIFVPLAHRTVLLEGAFVRVSTQNPDERAQQELKTEQALDQVTGSVSTSALPDAKAKAKPVSGVEPAKEKLPLLQFELLPRETALDVVRFAGGLLPEAYPDSLSLLRDDREGLTVITDIPMTQLGEVELLKGDVLSAHLRKVRTTRMVSVDGWVRVPGSFGRPDGLRVGDLLRRDRQVLPDSYLERGEITRTREDGTRQYLPFDVARALAGEEAHNLLLQDRDRVELVQRERMRLPRFVSVSGPLTSPGRFVLFDDMRVSDLLFKGGLLEKSANRFEAELSRFKNGQISEVIRLELDKLVSTETGSPVSLRDDVVNPLLREDDQLTVFELPQFKIHRTVKIQGQVNRPGTYTIEAEHFTLSQLVERAGGLTPQAMVKAGIFIRNLRAEGLSADGATLGLSDILERLAETKMYVEPGVGTTGQASVPKLFRPPILHGYNSAKDNRVVLDFEKALQKDPAVDPELQDGDLVVIPRQVDSVIVLGELATPFAYYKIRPGMNVADLLNVAGGTTRNADTRNLRLVKADGRIIDSWVRRAKVEPGDALIVPQRIRRDSTWQENLTALTPLAILLNVLK